jgi:diguanylate cyclase (GGDEF)-like protein
MGVRRSCVGILLAFLMLAENRGKASVTTSVLQAAGHSVQIHRPSSIPNSRTEQHLQHILQVRTLNPDQAAQHLPVKLTGVVTAMPGYRNSFFFQDDTAGISVDRTDNAEVHPGDRIELTGTSGPGLFAPVVLASFVRVIGRASPPPAPRKTLGDLFGGVEDSQWIELHGVVRSARWTDLFGRSTLLLSLLQDGGSVDLLVQDSAAIDAARLIDAVVRVRGVCASSGNEKRQFVGSALLVPHHTDLSVEQPAPGDPFAAPVRPVRDILKLGLWQHRVRVAGVVTNQVPGEAIYLQDGSDGIRVETDSKVKMLPGTSVEAVGFPGMGEYAPILQAGLVRPGGHAPPVTALRIQAAEVITHNGASQHANYDQQLVQLQGTLIEEYRKWDQRILILTQGREVFEARLPVSDGLSRSNALSKGSLLSLTGICTIHVDSRLKPISFAVLLPSALIGPGQAIVILKQPPWWTPARTLMLLSVLAGAIITVILWVLVLRNRVDQQTRIIRDSENRFRYLAEHDGLTGLLNRVAILSALGRALDRALRENSSLTIVLADIDHFKLVNDEHGHLAGDAALCRFAEAVTQCIRPYDSAGRYGGEEFLLVLPGISGEDAGPRVSSLHHAISNIMVHESQAQFRMTCSLGAVFMDKPGGGMGSSTHSIEPRTLLAAADQALYEAKEAGRNRVVCHPLRTDMPSTSDAPVALAATRILQP